MSRIVVLGSGAWGTAIALSLHRRGGHNITLWSHSVQEARQIAAARENTLFLPGFPIPPEVVITASESVFGEADIVVSVVPSEFLRATLARIRPWLRPGQIIVSATKGVENNTFLRMTEVIAASLGQTVPPGQEHSFVPANHDTNLEVFTEDSAPQVSSSGIAPAPSSLDDLNLPIGAFSGPSFALEVAQAQPTAVTVAFSDPSIAARVQQEFSSETLRLYTTTDVIGVELGGALKNVIAIAAGIAAGVGLGHNSTAALITRGIAEITRLAVAAKPSPASPAPATWSSPAPAPSAATEQSDRHWAKAASSLKSWKASAAKSLKAYSPPAPPSASPAATTLKCPSPNRCSSSSTRAKTPAKPSRT